MGFRVVLFGREKKNFLCINLYTNGPKSRMDKTSESHSVYQDHNTPYDLGLLLHLSLTPKSVFNTIVKKICLGKNAK